MKNSFWKLAISLFLLVFCARLSLVGATGEIKKETILNPHAVTITWVTDKPSTSQVEYGAGTDYSLKTPLDSSLVTYHSVTINGLTPTTLYHYRVKSTDVFGNDSVGRDYTFTTLAQSSEAQAPVISDVRVAHVISDIEAAAIVAAGPSDQGPLMKTPEISSGGQPADQAPQPVKNKESETAPQEGEQLVKTEEPIKRTLIEKGGILLGRGKWQIEPSVTYVHTSANRITVEGYTILPVLVIGEISTEKVKRDIFISNLTLRYGIKNNLQCDVNIPYRHQYDRVSVEAPASETTRDFGGLGDISFGFTRQVAYEHGIIPDTIVGLSFKTRTGKEPYGRSIGLGTGHYGVKASMVAVKSSDPAILFASLAYTHNIERDDIEGYGSVKPGDTVDYSLGAAFALNYQLAFSAQLQQSITTKLYVDDDPVPGSFTNVVNFKYGLTWSVKKDLSYSVYATHGLTTDSPDLVIEVRSTHTF